MLKYLFCIHIEIYISKYNLILFIHIFYLKTKLNITYILNHLQHKVVKWYDMERKWNVGMSMKVHEIIQNME
jgi:hypothetical protein